MTALAIKINPATDQFQEDFAANAGDLPGAGLAWLDERREKAMDAFARVGVPNRRVEAWKFNDLASVLEDDLAPSAKFHGAVRTGAKDGIDIVDLATLDAKTPDWVRQHLGMLASGAAQPMGAASLALMRGGVAIRARKSATLHLDFRNPPQERDTADHSRVLIVVETGASLRLLESHTGEGAKQNLSNVGMEIVLKAGASLEHVRLQAESATALNILSLGVTLGRDAQYRALYAAVGARLSRVDAQIVLAEQGASATLHNVAVLGAGIADTTTVMEHASPHTTSRQLFKSVVGGRGRSVSQGRVHVLEGAAKSDSHQLFKALLLSQRAEADAKPELEIFADDVVCGHGTAIGALDDDALFYLRARGIPEREARGLLVRAFLEDAIQGFADEATQDDLKARLDAALAALEEAES